MSETIVKEIWKGLEKKLLAKEQKGYKKVERIYLQIYGLLKFLSSPLFLFSCSYHNLLISEAKSRE
jgi:hypothetical protein